MEEQIVDTGVHDAQRLKELQALPLERKIQITQTRIIEWYEHYQGQVYVSFSGGKDSTVLLDLARRIYPDIEAVFIDTGLEYPEIRDFVKSKDNVTWLRPEMNFKDVIKKYGYPVASKQISKKIYYAKKGSAWAKQYVDGTATRTDNSISQYCVGKRWLPLMKANFNVCSKCCDIMKKQPFGKYAKINNKVPMIGVMTDESALRKNAWIKTGCNGFNSSKPHSTPIAFWTEQDVLEYITRFRLPYSTIYGDIKTNGSGKYYTTGLDRTGCMFCMFGVHREKEPNRFQRMKVTHPKLYEYCMKPLDEGGLGLDKVLNYINVKH